MKATSNRIHRDGFPLSGGSLSTEQIAAAASPRLSIHELVAPANASSATPSHAFAGRPYSVWRNRPELAFEINERLSKAAA